MKYQWRVQDFQRKRQLLRVGVPTYYLTIFFQKKLYENEILARGGAHVSCASLHPPLNILGLLTCQQHLSAEFFFCQFVWENLAVICLRILWGCPPPTVLGILNPSLITVLSQDRLGSRNSVGKGRQWLSEGASPVADLRGVRDACPPLWPKISSFSCSFREKLAK